MWQMIQHGILIIRNRDYISLPSKTEIESYFDNSLAVFESDFKNCINDINDGKYNVLVLYSRPNTKDQKKLEFALNYLKHKPSIVYVNDNVIEKENHHSIFDEACIHIRPDDNIKYNLFYAIDAALKRYRLTEEISRLEECLEHAKSSHNIVELTLAYNHEINNLLTTIIGNTQLLLKQSSRLDSNTAKKLEKIGIDAQKIREMAIGLINIINAPADSLPLSEV